MPDKAQNNAGSRIKKEARMTFCISWYLMAFTAAKALLNVGT
jgi:hypothetical protein